MIRKYGRHSVWRDGLACYLKFMRCIISFKIVHRITLVLVRKNPAREAALHGYCVKGESIRVTAGTTRIPEGL
jgi:hypothetical protein